MTTMVEARRFTARRPDLSGARIFVLGLGKSGTAAARFCLARGAEVIAHDLRDVGQRLPGADLRLGAEHATRLPDEIDLVVLSPGVPRTNTLVRQALGRSLPVWGEIELAWRFCRGRVIGITGSNGKSTVTSLTGAMLRAAGVRGGTGGNLDTPFIELLADDAEDAIHVVELSSFQLESVETLDCDVSVWLNLSPDHLDRYEDYDAYAAAKARLLALQSAGRTAIVNADDEGVMRRARTVADVARFSTRTRPAAPAAWCADGRLRVDELDVAADDAFALPGEHNRSNALAALLAAHRVGCPVEAMRDALTSFRALPHRLELVHERSGVRFYDDSKATNVESMQKAVAAFDAGRVHLILGGRDKGADWSAALAPIAERLAHVWLIGEAAGAIAGAIDVTCTDVHTVDAAVAAAFDAATPGQVVLLSPACASFDQFRNFVERGEAFAAAARALGAGDA